MKSQETDILIVGAGISGLAHAYAAAVLGYSVVVVEKNMRPTATSGQNFGLIWPIGQSSGTAYNLAIKSTQIWKQLSEKAGFWLKRKGAIFLAQHDVEMEVLKEFQESAYTFSYNCKLLNASRLVEYIGPLSSNKLKGALLSDTELTVNSNEAIPAIIAYLREVYQVKFVFGKAVTRIEMPYILAGKYMWKTQQVYICNGHTTSILYPEKLDSQNVQHCQVQMMQATSKDLDMRNLPAIATGLALIQYPSFRHCSSVEDLRNFLKKKIPLAIEYGISLLVSTYNNGKIIIGDSRKFGLTPDNAIDMLIHEEILQQLKSIIHIPELKVEKLWLGNYLQTIGAPMLNQEMEESVHLVTGMGNSAMTLSFGIAEENLREFDKNRIRI